MYGRTTLPAESRRPPRTTAARRRPTGGPTGEGKVMTRKHIWAGASLAAALVLGTATGAGAVPGPEVTRDSVTFTISSDDCSQVPAGTTLEGTGERISIGYE